MNISDYSELFEDSAPNPPASADHLVDATRALFEPLSADERASLLGTQGANPGADGSLDWPTGIPTRCLPDSYLAFLSWANGGDFRRGERAFEPMLRIEELREYLVSYQFVSHAPGALPFAMDGGGNFLVFDLRAPIEAGEYPIYFFPHACYSWAQDAVRVASSFVEACRGETAFQ